MPAAGMSGRRGAPLVPESHADFVALTLQRDEDIDLARAALLLARPVYPDLAVDPYLATLDRIADEVRAHSLDGDDARATVAVLNRQLYEVEGFRGNEREYYDPRN